MTHTIAIAKFEERLFAVCLTAFNEIVRSAASCETNWKKRLATFNRHGLLSFVMPNPIKAPPIEIDHERLENDPIYRRRIAHKLTRPRPGKTVSGKIELDRMRLLADDNYFNDICKLLAYRFTGNLLPVADGKDELILAKMDAEFIAACLDKMGPHEIDAAKVAGTWLRREVEALVDKHPRFIEGVNAIAAVAAEERAKLTEFCKELAATTMACFNAATGKILAELNADADAYLAERKRIADTAPVTTPVKTIDPEVEFRLAVDKRAREHREANRLGLKGKIALWLGGLLTTALLTFHLKVEGVTLAEAIAPLF